MNMLQDNSNLFLSLLDKPDSVSEKLIPLNFIASQNSQYLQNDCIQFFKRYQLHFSNLILCYVVDSEG